MRLIAVLDRAHLSNTLFIKSLCSAMASVTDVHLILVHADNAFTEELIQTGFMREEARERCTREISKKMTTYMADFGIACLNIHGFQRSTIQDTDQGVKVNTAYLNTLPDNTVWLISNLIENKAGKIEPIPLTDLAFLLKKELEAAQVLVFQTGDSAEIFADKQKSIIKWSEITENQKNMIPEEFHNINKTILLCNLNIFNNLKDFYSGLIIEQAI